jgi:hypothetical protein
MAVSIPECNPRIVWPRSISTRVIYMLGRWLFGETNSRKSMIYQIQPTRNTRVVPGSILAPRKDPTVPRNDEIVPRNMRIGKCAGTSKHEKEGMPSESHSNVRSYLIGQKIPCPPCPGVGLHSSTAAR